MAYELIETIEVGAGGAATIEFTSIPQDGTALLCLMSFRNNAATNLEAAAVTFNNDTSNNSRIRLRAYGTGSVDSSSSTGSIGSIEVGAANLIASSYGNAQIYIPNYASSNSKSAFIDQVFGTDDSTWNREIITAGLYANSTAITSLKFDFGIGDFEQYSTASLYKITTADATGATGGSGNFGSAKATGGTTSLSGGYWYHTFTSSGTFTPTEALDVDVLVVAGGGGGGSTNSGNSVSGGGGGAGGYLATTQSLTTTGYSVVIGAGGAGGAIGANKGSEGVNSTFNGLVAIGGGGGAAWSATNAGNGGSGGGGTGFGQGNPGTGTAGQGNDGGQPGNDQRASGGGGAGEAGYRATDSFSSPRYASPDGKGGDGLQWLNGIYYAGGGGGGENGDDNQGIAIGGLGGGGSSSTSGTGTSGSANRGGGGAGTNHVGSSGGDPGANGGSGVVIIRYAA